jgi:hypothetical protein
MISGLLVLYLWASFISLFFTNHEKQVIIVNNCCDEDTESLGWQFIDW